MLLFLLCLNVYFAATLAISGLSKASNTTFFTKTLENSQIFPNAFSNFIAKALPYFELFIALAIVSTDGLLAFATSLILFFLFLSFLVFKIMLLTRKKTTDCGCYGKALVQENDISNIIVSTILLLLTGVHLWLTWVESINWELRLLCFIPIFGLTCLILGKLLKANKINFRISKSPDFYKVSLETDTSNKHK